MRYTPIVEVNMKFPMKFEVIANAQAGISVPWSSKVNNYAPIPSAIPPEFSGPGGGYSPEDFFALAVLNCIIAMYKVYCEKSKITFNQLDGKAVLTVDRHPSEPTFHMAHIEFFLDVQGLSNVEKGKQLLDAAVKDCPVSNSIKSGKSFHIKTS